MRRSWLAVVVIILLGCILALPIVTYPLGRDQGEFATIGYGVLHGKIPYTELWNPKPPAVFYAYALAIALFGPTSEAVRSLDFGVMVLGGWGLFWLARRWQGQALGLVVTAAFIAIYATENFWTLSQNDGLVLVPMLWAMVAMVQAGEVTTQRRRWLWLALAGALSAMVLWFKYPFVLFVAVVVLGYGWLYRPMGRRLWGDGVAFAVGGLLVGGGGMLYLHQHDALAPMIESARVTSAYTRLGFTTEPFWQSTVWKQAVHDRWVHWRLWGVVAALGLVVPRSRQAEALSTGAGRWRGVVVLWALGAVGIMLMQAKGYDYHWLPLLAPLMLLAGDGVARALTWLTARRLRQTILSTVLVGCYGWMGVTIWRPAWPYVAGQESRLEYYHEFRGGEYVADESQQVVDYLRARTTPGQTLFIWGFRAEVYYLTELEPATRFIFNFPLVAEWYPKVWMDETVQELWQQEPPPYVILMRGDYMPWVTGIDADSLSILQDQTELNNWIMYHYEPDTEIGGFWLWKRRPQP